MGLAFLLGVIGVLRQRSRVAQLHKVGHIQRSLLHPEVGLLYQDCKDVPREPGATNMIRVKTETQKDVTRGQWAVKITAGKPKGSRPIHAR